jgi:3-methyladenine DNA glycosylase AlkD
LVRPHAVASCENLRMPVDARGAVEFFRGRFVAGGKPERAAAERAYLKSTLRFHGVGLPEIRRAAAAFCRSRPELTLSDLRAVVDALYETDYHDLRSAGIGVLERRRDLLTPADAPWLIGLVRRSGNWAHVDWLAIKVVAAAVAEDPGLARRVRAWSKDPDLWVRRTALLVQHDALRSGDGDFALFAEIAAPMLPEKEFFIRKALGWLLRETSRRRPDLAFRFLHENRERVSGLTLREGAKHLPATLRAELVGPKRARRASARRKAGATR